MNIQVWGIAVKYYASDFSVYTPSSASPWTKQGSYLYRLWDGVLEFYRLFVMDTTGDGDQPIAQATTLLVSDIFREGLETRIWKVSAVALQKVLFRHLPGVENGKPRKTIFRTADGGIRTHTSPESGLQAQRSSAELHRSV